MRSFAFGALLTVFIWSMFALTAFGQECGAGSPSAPAARSAAKSFALPATSFRQSGPAPEFRSLPKSGQEELPATREELDFIANGPKLFTMEQAERVHKLTGKPVVCWVGPNVFADARAREASAKLGDTTIQARMISDGETTDADGKRLPALRVKFSTSNYAPTAQTAYIPVSKLDGDSPAKILRFVRGNTGR